MKQRIAWVDELKGFILIIICLGHISGMIITPPVFRDIVDTLTMIRVPTFFFISGILFRTGNHTLKSFVLSKTKSLLIPYFMLSLLFTVFDPYTYSPSYLVENMHYPRFAWPVSLDFDAYTKASLEFFLGDICCIIIGISSRATLPLWFVFVLYFVTISYFFLQEKIKSQGIMAISAVCAFASALLLCKIGLGSIMKVGPIFMAFFFYWSGVMSARYLRQINQYPSIILLILSTLCFLLFYASIHYLANNISFVNGIFPVDRPLLFLVCSFAGIYGFLSLFIMLSRYGFCGFGLLKGVLRNIARNSLIVLAMHYVLLVFFSLSLRSLFEERWLLMAAIIFIVSGCIASIVIFRTKLYMFIGGKRAKQNIYTCLSIK